MVTIKQSDAFQLFRFCVVGTGNAIIDFGILNLLLWLYPTTNTWQMLGYNSLAVLLAATNSFFWNKYWTFKQPRPASLQEVFRFIILTSSTVVVNDLCMQQLSVLFPGLVNSTVIGANFVKLGAIIGTMSISFFGMRLWVFLWRDRDAGKHEITNLLTTSLVTAAIHLVPTVRLNSHCIIKTLIIIPTYNEFANLSALLHEIFCYAPATDVLIVDDNSPDGTGRLAEFLSQNHSQIYVLHRPGKLGLGTAYIAGFKYAIAHGYDAVFEMDADFSHHPCYLPDFLRAIQKANVVIGSRYISGGSTPDWSVTRHLISSCGNLFARFLLGIPIHDCTGGYRCYQCDVLQSIELDTIQAKGYAFQIELTYRVLQRGFTIVETPITFMDRRHGSSKMSRSIVLEAFTYVVRTRLREGLFIRRHVPVPQSVMVCSGNGRDSRLIGKKTRVFPALVGQKNGKLGASSLRPLRLVPLHEKEAVS